MFCYAYKLCTKRQIHRDHMALACRFCHPDPVRTQQASYAIVAMFGDAAGVDLQVARIEQMGVVIPGHCIRCEACLRYSMISHSLVCYMHGESAEKDPLVHYANLCRSFQMLHCASDAEKKS